MGNWFYSPGYRIEQLRFVDNAAWTMDLAQIHAAVNTGTAGDDVLTGWDEDLTLNGLDGNDTIQAGIGNDTVNGGTGNDTLTDKGGNDTINGGSGDDLITTYGIGSDIARWRVTAPTGFTRAAWRTA